RTTPERLWDAITNPEIRAKYNFGASVVSDWKPGSHFKMGAPNANGLLGEGDILEADPPRRLVHTMTALWRDEVRGEGAAGATVGSAGGAACVLMPETTEGPYYLDLKNVRSDVTEGRPGAPLALTITTVDATACTPIKDAAVDIWHCDAAGEYSGFGPGGST